MTNELEPIVGGWYRYTGGEQTSFQIIDIDAKEGIIEIQHFDGDLEALDLETWPEFDIEAIEPPEDWTGPIDDLERDDLGYSDDGSSPQRTADALEAVRREREP